MNAHQPLKKTTRLRVGIKIVDLDKDSFPFEVHAVVEEETVEAFEFRKLGFRKILSNEMPNFRGQVGVENHEIRPVRLSPNTCLPYVTGFRNVHRKLYLERARVWS